MHFAERLLLPGPRSVDLVSKGFDRVRNPRKEAAEGEEEAPPSPDPPQEAPVQRSESARGWGPGAEEEQMKLMASLKEEYGSGAEEGENDAAAAAQGEEEGEVDESYNNNSNEESYGQDRSGEGDSLMTDEEWAQQLGDGEGGESPGQHEQRYGDGSLQQHPSMSITREDVAKRRVIGGAVSGYKHKQELQETLERKAALKFIRERKADVSNREKVMIEADDKVATIKGHIEEIDSKAGQMRAEAERLYEEDQFTNRDRINIITSKVDALMNRRDVEQANLETEADVAYHARREFNNAQIELRRVEELEPQLIAEEDMASAEARILSELRAEKETQAALRFEKLRSKRVEAKDESNKLMRERTDAAVRDAKAGRVAAIKRVKEARARQQENEAKFNEVKESERQKRIDALLNLRENMGAVEDRIKGQNEKKMKKQKQVKQRREAEKSEILAAGGNPYAVWRQQDAERKERQKEQARKDAMKEQGNKLLVQITAEEKRRKAADEIERRHKQEMKVFQKEMGGQAKREKIQRYMMDRTVGGKDVLDPTGREARIYPSKVTVLKDHSFGLGKTPYPPGASPGKEVPPGFPRGYEKEDPAGVEGEGWRLTQKDRRIEKMSGMYPDETFNNTLVGSKSMGETRSIKHGATRRGAGGYGGDVELVETLGADTLQLGLDKGEGGGGGGGGGVDEGGSSSVEVPADAKPKLDESHAVPEFTGLWSAEDALGNSPKKRSNMSKLESRYMAEALARKKAGYGWIEKQVVFRLPA